MPDDELPECTAEERWERPIKYAVKKEGRKSALRVLDSLKDAENYMAEKKLFAKHFVETRQGESVRCESYCAVQPFCNQYKGGG